MFNRLNAAPNPQAPYSPGAFPSANAWIPPEAQPWQPSQAPQQSTGTGFQNLQQPGVQAAPWENAPYGFQSNPWQMQPWVPPWAPWQQAGQTGTPDPAQQYTLAGTSAGIPGFDPTVPGGGMHEKQLAPKPKPAQSPINYMTLPQPYRGSDGTVYASGNPKYSPSNNPAIRQAMFGSDQTPESRKAARFTQNMMSSISDYRRPSRRYYQSGYD